MKQDLYLGNVLEAFSGGAQLDLRFRLAVELMKAHGPHQLPRSEGSDRLTLGDFSVQTAKEHAAYWLDASEELVALSEKRGWLVPLPDDDSLSRVLRLHIRRNQRANVFQQHVAQQIAAEEMGPQLQRAVDLPVNGRG